MTFYDLQDKPYHILCDLYPVQLTEDGEKTL